MPVCCIRRIIEFVVLLISNNNGKSSYLFRTKSQREHVQQSSDIRPRFQHRRPPGYCKTGGRPEGSVMTSEEILAEYSNIVRRLKKGDRICDIAELEHLSTKTVQKVENALGCTTMVYFHGGKHDISWNRLVSEE